MARQDKVTNVIRRTAGEVKRYRIMMRVLPITMAVLVALLAVIYVISLLYDNYGSFTVTVNKMDNAKYALTLSETPDFANPSGRLNCKANKEITNIDGATLPLDLDNIDGSHNGENYVAYTFYCMNAGTAEVSYEYQVVVSNMSLDIEKAVRVRLYVNGEYTDYARTRTDGTGPEAGTTEFYTERTVTRGQFDNFAPGDITKFTAVIWLEGNDVDCIDTILGGEFKLDMVMNILGVGEAA